MTLQQNVQASSRMQWEREGEGEEGWWQDKVPLSAISVIHVNPFGHKNNRTLLGIQSHKEKEQAPNPSLPTNSDLANHIHIQKKNLKYFLVSIFKPQKRHYSVLPKEYSIGIVPLSLCSAHSCSSIRQSRSESSHSTGPELPLLQVMHEGFNRPNNATFLHRSDLILALWLDIL